MRFRTTAMTAPPAVVNMDILGLQSRRTALSQKEDDMNGLYLEIDDGDLEVDGLALAGYARQARQKASFSDPEIVRLLRLLAQSGEGVGQVIAELQALGVIVGTTPEGQPALNENRATSLLWQKYHRELQYQATRPANYLNRVY